MQPRDNRQESRAWKSLYKAYKIIVLPQPQTKDWNSLPHTHTPWTCSIENSQAKEHILQTTHDSPSPCCTGPFRASNRSPLLHPTASLGSVFFCNTSYGGFACHYSDDRPIPCGRTQVPANPGRYPLNPNIYQ